MEDVVLCQWPWLEQCACLPDHSNPTVHLYAHLYKKEGATACIKTLLIDAVAPVVQREATYQYTSLEQGVQSLHYRKVPCSFEYFLLRERQWVAFRHSFLRLLPLRCEMLHYTSNYAWNILFDFSSVMPPTWLRVTLLHKHCSLVSLYEVYGGEGRGETALQLSY